MGVVGHTDLWGMHISGEIPTTETQRGKVLQRSETLINVRRRLQGDSRKGTGRRCSRTVLRPWFSVFFFASPCARSLVSLDHS